MSPELRVRFGPLPKRLHVAGTATDVEFGLSEAAAAAAERTRLDAEEESRRDALERERTAIAERDARFGAAVNAAVALDAKVRADLDGELTALEPELARLALGIAARVLGGALGADPLLLRPAVASAIAALRKGIEEPGLTTVFVAADALASFASALQGDGAVRVVAEPTFAPGQFEVRCDIRRVRHSVHAQLEAIAAELGRTEVSCG